MQNQEAHAIRKRNFKINKSSRVIFITGKGQLSNVKDFIFWRSMNYDILNYRKNSIFISGEESL